MSKKSSQSTTSILRAGATAASKQRSLISGAAQKGSIKKHNPFETKVSKPKFDILNRSAIGSTGRPTHSKARSLQKRAKTILPELQRRGRTGDFADRRFGERNPALSMDEKMLERFSRERLRTKRAKAVFNLNDGPKAGDAEEEKNESNYKNSLTLTHRGRSLDDLDVFNSDPDEDLDYGDDLDADTVSSGHFGGERSRAEIMQEVIAKSKRHRLERQIQREEDEALCDALDADFNTLISQGALPATRPSREASHIGLKERDEYEEAMRSMTFDRRSQPSDRTKLPEELEKEATKKANEFIMAQRKRMLEEPDDEESDGYNESELGADESRKNAGLSSSEELDDSEKSIRKVMKQVRDLLDTIRNTPDLTIVNESFTHFAALARTNSVIPVARVVREELGKLTESFSKLLKRGKTPKMPDRGTLMLLQVIGRTFCTSDFHHIVTTPTMLLMGAFLERGRLLRREHLLSAIFLIQTCLTYTAESKRFFPEALSLLHVLASLAIARNSSTDSLTWNSYPAVRCMSKSIHEFLTTTCPMDETLQIRPVAFRDLVTAESVSKPAIVGFLLYLVRTTAVQYKDNVAAPEILEPFLRILQQETSSDVFTDVKTIVESALESREPLQMLKKKALSIPSLVPDFDGDKSQTREEREHQRLQRTYKREFKGAKRELRRDSTFLAQQKLKMRLEEDRKYNERIRQIIGTIANDAATGRVEKGRRT